MKTFVISLKRSEDRRLRVQKILNDAAIDFEFFDAVDASEQNFKHSNRKNPSKTKLKSGYYLLESELACFASHLSIWEKCVALNQSILVLEDNIQITPELHPNLSILEELTNKYQLIKLCSLNPKNYKLIDRKKGQVDIIRYIKKATGAQGYTITPEASKKLISNAKEFVEPVDDYMGKTWKHKVSAYSVHPDLVVRADVQSTIGSSRKDKSSLKFYNKIYIEVYRLYEQIREKLTRHCY